MKEDIRPVVVIITGLSGSGKSVALRALEDAGFFCVDNLPVTLMESFISIISAGSHTRKIGIGIDIREKEFLPEFASVMMELRKNYVVEIIFLDAEKDALIRRFRETRRPHPLASGDIRLEGAIDTENRLLLPLKNEADRIIDTSSYTPHQLRHMISSLFRASAADNALTVNLISFGYKFGIPQNIDLLLDVRFIPNPYFIPSLKEHKGTDVDVRDFVMGQPSTQEFLSKAEALLDFLIPQYVHEGKAYLTIGLGCTGGRHRSPVVVETIAEHIRSKHSIAPVVVHRDME